MGFQSIQKLALLGSLGIGLMLNQASAATFTMLNGERAASVSFTQTGANELTVTLTNTSTFDIVDPGWVLTGVLWTLANNVVLTSPTADVSGGSAFVYSTTANNPLLPGTTTASDVSGEWAYKYSNDFAYGTFDYGLGAAGFSPANLFGSGDVMSGNDRNGGSTAPNGLDFGILSAGDNTATGNGAVLNKDVLIKNSVTFTFVTPVGFNWNTFQVTSVGFLYGTASSDSWNPQLPPNETGVPEPSTFAMVGLAGIAAYFKIRRR